MSREVGVSMLRLNIRGLDKADPVRFESPGFRCLLRGQNREYEAKRMIRTCL